MGAAYHLLLQIREGKLETLEKGHFVLMLVLGGAGDLVSS